MNLSSKLIFADYTKLKVNRDEIIEAAKRIRTRWRDIGEILGPEPRFQSHELDGFGEGRDERERAKNMLKAWAEKHYTKATREHLIKAMEKEGYREQISEVFKASSAQPTPIEVRSDGVPEEEEDITKYEKNVGKILIVNNFKSKNSKERIGSKEDGDRLVKIFHEDMKFERGSSQRQIQIVNETKDQILDAVNSFVHEDFTGYSCSVFILMSHGNESSFFDVNNEEIEIVRILNLFKSKQLEGKPKLFFFQACRGEGHAGTVASDCHKSEESSPPVESDLISIPSMPNSADFFIGYSSSFGDRSFRYLGETSRGSWYMLRLVEVIKKYYTRRDVAAIHCMVNRLVSEDRGHMDLGGSEVMQAPQFVSSLRGKFYLCNYVPPQ